jgi:peptidoglycan/xylan/chitin deacetylase (PgdA/CDA1 family)
MFLDRDIKGDPLPPKTVCLTYDDGPGQTTGSGPGPRTLELGRYLFEQGIEATFFVIGANAARYPEVLRQLHAWGHLIGNHTYNHPGLVALAEQGGDVVGEIARTDAVLRNLAPARIRFFRAPYGNWRQKASPGSQQDKPTSIVAEILNRNEDLSHYVGPVNWDISAADYDYWRRGASADECAAAYLQKIDSVGKGIVLMHDSSEEEAVRLNNRTWQATKLLIPVLKERCYRFVRLDNLPQLEISHSWQDG